MQLTGIKKGVLSITRHNDLILALLVVAIIALIILPLPTSLVDTLIAINLGLAITLLILSMYIPNAVSLSTFPTLLLFTTLFRLSLNIATTRLILIDANAGKIIHTFGNFVVAGDFVVGAVIFLIITIVQFVVIAKGSERVAEVAARFTLDAMPGKQMSIDADVRAGSIEMDEARRRRTAVQMESSLYGAMDGAMKFVKGDAISGLIITVINILGGIAIGVLQKEMDAGKALETYAILTIGDGLISQIPALFISITAGIIVTRSNNEGENNLGSEIGFQLLSQPKGLLISGCLLSAFALIPGFPKLQFIFIGLSIALVGFIFFKKNSAFEDDQEETQIDSLESALGPLNTNLLKAKEEGDFSPIVPLQVDLDFSIKDQIDPMVFNRELIQIRRALYTELGVPFPGIHLNLSESLEKGEYVIRLHEIPIARGKLNPNHLFVLDSPEYLSVMAIKTVDDKQFLPVHPTVWTATSNRQELDTAGLSYMTVTRLLAYHLSIVLKQHAAEFLGLQEIKQLMDKMSESYPDVVEELQKVLPIPQITDVLKRLVQEEISIKNLKAIFEGLIEWGQKEKDIVLLTEYIRMGLKRYISYRYSDGQNMMAVYMLDQEVEEIIRKSIRKTGGSSYLVLSPDQSKPIVDAIKEEVGDTLSQPTTPVLLTSMDIRRYVKKLVETEIKKLPVLSYQELMPDMTIQPLGRVYLGKGA